MPHLFKCITLRLHSHRGGQHKRQQSAAGSNGQHTTPTAQRPFVAPTTSTPTTMPTPPSSLTGSGSAPIDFWALALRGLPKEYQEAFKARVASLQKSNHPPSTCKIEDLCHLIEQKRDDCERKKLKLSFGGHQIVLRDVAAKAVGWLQSFIAVGDVAVGFDPVHAALPWAVVRFLLQSVTANDDQMGFLLLGMERFTYLTTRCRIYESLYTSANTPDLPLEAFHASLLKLYIVLLSFLIDAIRIYEKNVVQKTIEAIFNPGAYEKFKGACTTAEQQVETEANNCERTNRQSAASKTDSSLSELLKLLDSMKEPFVRVDRRLDDLWNRSNQGRMGRILDWISDIQYEKIHKDAKTGRTLNTGNWLLSHERYRQWRQSSASTILWLHGIPGAGKTKLVTTVIDDTVKLLNSHINAEGMAYFYCDREQLTRQNPSSVLRSYIRQLSIPRTHDGIHDLIVERYNTDENKGFVGGPLDYDTCQDILLQLVDVYPQTTLILDALDECSVQSRTQIIDAFDYIVKNASGLVKILVSSRANDDIKFRLATGSDIDILATDNQDDIEKFILAQLHKDSMSRRIPFSRQLNEDIVKTVQQKSDGMFQWAALQIQQLLELHLEDDIRLRLGRLPKDLKHTYDEIFQSIVSKNGSEPSIALKAFLLVMGSRNELYIEDIITLLCQDPQKEGWNTKAHFDIDFVLGVCNNLLVIRGEPDARTIRFAHLSVVEYLEEHQADQINRMNANNLVAEIYLRGLLVGASTDEYDDKVSRSLTSDLDRYWPFHIQLTERLGCSHLLEQLMMQFLGSINIGSSAYTQWIGRVRFARIETIFGDINAYNLQSASCSALAVCIFGIYRSIRPWWESKSIDIGQKNSRGMSLLYLAASYGSVIVCEKLAELGVDVNEVYTDEGATALARAAKNGDEAVVEVLLRHGADVNAMCLHTPLRMASEYGKLQVLATLIQKGADINHTTNERPSALCLASQNGHEEVVQLLLANGAITDDLHEKGHKKHTPLSAASAHGHESIVIRLLGANANIDNASTQYGTALEAAARNGNEKMLQILLGAEANVNARGRMGCTALYAAALHGHDTIARLLLDAGADVNAGGDDGETALHATAETKDDSMMQMLLCAGAGVDARGCGDKTALMLAAELSRPDKMLQTLLKLKEGANVHVEGGNYHTASRAAATSKIFADIIKQLLNAGANVNAEGGYYHTALQAAAANSSSAGTIKLLLDAGADVNAQGGRWGTALIAASWYGPSTVVRTLLDAGADVNILTSNPGIRTALEAAQGNHPWNNVVVQQMLVDAGAIPLVDLFEEYRTNDASASQKDTSRRRDGWFREEKIPEDLERRARSRYNKPGRKSREVRWFDLGWEFTPLITTGDTDEVVRRERLLGSLEDSQEFESMLEYMGLMDRCKRLKSDMDDGDSDTEDEDGDEEYDEWKDLAHMIFEEPRWNEAYSKIKSRKGKEVFKVNDIDASENRSSMESKSDDDDDDDDDDDYDDNDDDDNDNDDYDEFHDCREE